MWKIGNVKSNARHSMKKNYVACLVVSLIMIFLVDGTISVSETIDDSTRDLEAVAIATNWEGLENAVENIKMGEEKFRNATTIGDQSSEGFISNMYHSTKTAGTAAGGLLLIVDKLFMGDRISTTIITACGAIIALLFFIFVENLLRVGAARFYMENILYGETAISKLLTIFKLKKVRHTAWIMFCRTFFNLLWCLTIVGGVIKFYSYRMIPYILAENPDISRKEAFELSKRMMDGNKFRTFLLDISFIHWYILSIITFGLVQYLYLGPYQRAAYAELYLEVRSRALDTNITECLVIPEHIEKKWLHFDFHRHYTIYNLILIFFAFAIFGWIWECTLHIVQEGHFVNRGSLYGPWIPIYGFGGVGLVVLLRRFVDRPIVTFFLGVLICGILEGGTAWYLDAVKGMRYWDYSNFYFNIHGYVCLEGLLVFGLGGCMFIYLLAPMIDTYLNKVPKKGRIAMCAVLVSAFCADNIYTHFNPHVGEGIGGYVDNDK